MFGNERPLRPISITVMSDISLVLVSQLSLDYPIRWDVTLSCTICFSKQLYVLDSKKLISSYIKILCPLKDKVWSWFMSLNDSTYFDSAWFKVHTFFVFRSSFILRSAVVFTLAIALFTSTRTNEGSALSLHTHSSDTWWILKKNRGSISCSICYSL